MSLLDYGWLYALHARSSIERGKLWQAEYMLSLVRDQVLAAACVRHGLPWREARGMDRLPAEEKRRLEAALVRSLDPGELRRALKAVIDCLAAEIEHADPVLAKRIVPALRELAGS